MDNARNRTFIPDFKGTTEAPLESVESESRGDRSEEFLKSKGMIKEGFTKFQIQGDFGSVCLNDLLEDYFFYRAGVPSSTPKGTRINCIC